jgi:hypothetical protein
MAKRGPNMAKRSSMGAMHFIHTLLVMEQAECTNLGHRGQTKINQSRSTCLVATGRSVRPTTTGSEANNGQTEIIGLYPEIIGLYPEKSLQMMQATTCQKIVIYF